MSKYTTEVRFICENAAGLIESLGEGAIEDIITRAAPKVFNFDFPIFDESYRLTLENRYSVPITQERLVRKLLGCGSCG